jgi:hypothetical protein
VLLVKTLRRTERRIPAAFSGNLSENQMITFKDREKGFEKKFALDEEMKFKANVRCNRLVGLWAAKRLGLDDAAADAYAKEIVTIGFEHPGSDSVFTKLRTDFDAHGVVQSDHQIRRTLEEFMLSAIAEIRAGG